MADMLFYHLERDPLDRVLPPLLEKSLERGWRCVVQTGTVEQRDVLDTLLWTYRDDSFLAHATADTDVPERQPILLTTEDHNLNGAQARFLVGGATIQSADGYERVVYMFDGHDPAAVFGAREVWRWAKGAALAVTYWQQADTGRWQKKA